MSTSKGKRNNKSLCEKSIKIAVNIIKLSSLSLARFSLAPTGRQIPSRNLPRSHALPQAIGTMQKLQELEIEGMHSSYLMQPYEGKDSWQRVKEADDNVDERAMSYISKVHERNRNDSRSSQSKPANVNDHDIDGRAMSYINKVHERNRRDLRNSQLENYAFIIPPPPLRANK